MFIKTRKVKTKYTRKSKSGNPHTYNRQKTVVELKCDSCNTIFERDLGRMDLKRISNDFLHVCVDCNQKQFAQKTGADSRRFWNIPADSDIDITKL
jgi:hypothetical protein